MGAINGILMGVYAVVKVSVELLHGCISCDEIKKIIVKKNH